MESLVSFVTTRDKAVHLSCRKVFRMEGPLQFLSKGTSYIVVNLLTAREREKERLESCLTVVIM